KVASEIVLRVYLLIGAVALTGLIALASTSTDAAVRRLGAPRWDALHRPGYAIALLGSVHFFIQSQLEIYQPVLMAGFLLLAAGLPRPLSPAWRGDAGPAPAARPRGNGRDRSRRSDHLHVHERRRRASHPARAFRCRHGGAAGLVGAGGGPAGRRARLLAAQT